VAETLGSRALATVMGVLISVAVARALGPEGRGVYAVAVAIAAVGIQFGNLGLHASNTYAVAKNPHGLPALVANSLLVSVVAGVLCSGAWLVLVSIPDILPLPPPLLALSLLAVPIGLALLLSQNLLVGTGQIHAYNGVELLVRSVVLTGSLLIVIVGAATPGSFLVASVIASIAGVVVAVRLLLRTPRAAIRADMELLRGHLRYGLRAYAAALFAFLVLRVDLILMQYILGPTQTGYYSIAVALADLVYLPATVAGLILFPRLVKADQPLRRLLTVEVASIVGIAMVCATIVAALLAEPAIRLLFGVEFLPAVGPFVWLLPGIALLSVNTIFMNYFAAVGMPMFTIWITSAAFALNVALNVVLQPFYGPTGASLASVGAYGLMLIASLVYFNLRRAGVDAH
jgi:O-antigen/teichoic acid export membrane protein